MNMNLDEGLLPELEYEFACRILSCKLEICAGITWLFTHTNDTGTESFLYLKAIQQTGSPKSAGH